MFGKANSLVTLPLGVVVFAWFGYRVGNGRMQVIFAPLVKLGNYIEGGPHLCASLPTENNRVNNKGEN